MQQPNSSKQFLKIPTNWENVTWEKRNIYVAYLWLKNYSRFGRVHKSLVPKRKFGHWLTKLTSTGLVRVEGEFYTVISYERVWELLGIKKVAYRGENRYLWRKLPEYYDSSWGEFKKGIIEDIQTFQTERKKAQFRKRYRLAGSPPQEGGVFTPLFSAKSTAKLFGYKSSVTGAKYRERFFDLVPEPLKLRMHLTEDLLPYWKYDCRKIDLSVVFSGR